MTSDMKIHATQLNPNPNFYLFKEHLPYFFVHFINCEISSIRILNLQVNIFYSYFLLELE